MGMLWAIREKAMFLVKLQASESPRRPETVQVPALEEAIRIAVENRPEMRQSLLDTRNKDIDVDYTKNQKQPILDITASYNQNGTGGRQLVRAGIGGAAQQVIPGGISDAFRHLFGYGYTGYQVGLTFVLPLSNKAAEADYSRALNERQFAQSRLEAAAQTIALEVRNALMQVEMNRARIETAQTTRELAQQRLDAEQTKFSLGTSTLRFVLEEQRNVAQAETNELQSMVNFTKSLVDLDRSMGMTLRKNGVEMDKTLAAAK